jgi:hypothetical protein
MFFIRILLKYIIIFFYLINNNFYVDEGGRCGREGIIKEEKRNTKIKEDV